jgi:hypothetical protein
MPSCIEYDDKARLLDRAMTAAALLIASYLHARPQRRSAPVSHRGSRPGSGGRRIVWPIDPMSFIRVKCVKGSRLRGWSGCTDFRHATCEVHLALQRGLLEAQCGRHVALWALLWYHKKR